MTAVRRSGRRPGDSGTRAAILEAAKDSFAASGYDATTIRGVARAAAVDPALVHHFFGTKEQLFGAAMELPVDPAVLVPALLAEGTDGLGERLVRMFLTDAVLGPLARGVGDDRPELRATLVGSQMMGLAMARYVVRLDPLAAADVDTLAPVIGATVQRYLTGELAADLRE